MTLVFTLMLEMLLFLRAGAQSVTQADDHITVSEGARLELKCNYSSSVSPYLFWSVQFPDQGLQLLLKYVSGDNLVSGIKSFEAEFRRNEKSFHLRKIPAHWKVSAKYFCALSVGARSLFGKLADQEDGRLMFQNNHLVWVWVPGSFTEQGVRGMDVAQSPPALSLQEGASSTLWCNFSTFPDSVQWYLQNPGGRLTHLFSIPSGTRQDGRLNATTVLKERCSSLHISSLQTIDSGTYFCAVQHGAPQAPAASTRTLPGLSPSSSLNHSVRPHRAFAVLHVTHLHQDSFNHRHFLAYRLRTLVFIFPSQHVSPFTL
ncbi:unnamed protein product, partial [Rangifer tarandus platyrhynchus]|uniref:Uncharacterized protein n=1 Tax=Rangifer tarandus platyrhynchus TaxID=3082113 RepID=A0AC60A0J7_RANTA